MFLWWGCGYWLCWGENRISACCKASLISFEEPLKLILNYFGDNICWMVGFWIWVMVVMVSIWTLVKYLVACFFLS